MLFSTFSRTVKTKRKSFCRLLDAAFAYRDCKRPRWIFRSKSDFGREKLCGGSLRKFTSTRVVDLSALALFASTTDFILRCFSTGSATAVEVEGATSG